MMVSVYWYSGKVPFIRVQFYLNLNLLDRFAKNVQIYNFMKTHPLGPSCFIRTGGQTHMTKLIVVFRNWANAP
jgi:hypothetical protein